MPDDPTLTFTRQQRDRLASAYHDLQVAHTVQKAVLTQTQQKLAAAEQRITELEGKLAAAEQRITELEGKKTAAMLAEAEQADDAA